MKNTIPEDNLNNVNFTENTAHYGFDNESFHRAVFF